MLCSSFTVSISICITVLCFYHHLKEMSDYANFVKNTTFLCRMIIECFIELNKKGNIVWMKNKNIEIGKKCNK